MDIFTNLGQFADKWRNGIVAVGNFDGVHKGHQALLAETKKRAQKEDVPFGILTFEPHPRTLFQAPTEPFRITPISLKREKLEENGADFLAEIPFTRNFAQLSAQQFIDQILKTGLGVKEIIVGQDFHFGQNREGSIETLKKAGIKVSPLEDINNKQNQKYSASRIRTLLRRGLISEANDMLGWEWEICQEVIHGNKRGRELGYPTANMTLEDVIHPAFGIYATLVQIEDSDKWHKAATNIGIRPMFETKAPLLEAHLLDFDGDLYGKILRVKPVQHLRGEAKFESIEELIEQMDKDTQKTRDLLAV